jgi:predicted ATPase
MAAIKKLCISGYKSIRELVDLELHPLNILIGANGAGKSNFVGFFRFLREMVSQRLQLSVAKSGGADTILYLGPKITQRITGKFYFENNGYEFALDPTADNRLVFSSETLYFSGFSSNPFWQAMGSGHEESRLKGAFETLGTGSIASYVYPAVSNWVVYHFHDTSDTAPMKRECTVRDYEYLRSDGANLAAFLFRMKLHRKPTYDFIRDTVRMVAPFFDDFTLRPQKSGQDDTVQLEWTQVGSEYPFHPSQLSDGTLRFICLATALLQPELPATIIVDEPELGLHPYALNLLSDLIHEAAAKGTQVIVSTQSAALLDEFEPDDIIVVDRDKGQSRFRRLTADEIKHWLAEDYTLGELWQKNVYGGGPVHE